MKTALFSIIIALSIAGCTIDNYEMPALTLSGRIIDAQTNKPVESGGGNAGTIVRLYEGNSIQPIICNTKPDGSFENSRVFAGNYTYNTEGAFTPADTGAQRLVINNNTSVDIKVIPNVRLEASLVTLTGTTAKVKLKYEKVNTEQTLAQLGVMWSVYPNPNVLTFSGGSIQLEDADPQVPASGERTYTISDLKPGMKYYIRATARTVNPGNYYNYSPQFEIEAK
jgi:hypothetical protein